MIIGSCEFESHLGHLKMTARIDHQSLRSFPFRHLWPSISLAPAPAPDEPNFALGQGSRPWGACYDGSLKLAQRIFPGQRIFPVGEDGGLTDL